MAGDAAPEEPGMRSSSALQRLCDRIVVDFWSWGLVVLLVGIAPGLALWPVFHPEHADYIVKNELALGLRHDVLQWMVGSFFAVMFVYTTAWQILVRWNPKLGFADVCRRLNRYTFFVIVTPFLTALRYRGIEAKHGFITLVLVVLVTGFGCVLIYRLTGLDHPRPRRWPRWSWVLPWVCLAAIGTFYAAYLSHLAVLDHKNLGTHIWDLGIYDNLLWHTSRGDFLVCTYCKAGKHTSGHFDPILALLVPLYKLAPRAETLLIFQSCWLATGVLPLFLLAKQRLGNPWFGVLLAAVYVLYPALHGVNMFDFHSLTLAVPTFLWTVYLLDSGARWRYWLAFVVLLATREDMSLLSCFVGLYAIVRGRAGTGLVTIAIALTYLTIVKQFVMPDSGLLMQAKETSSFIYYYDEMIPHPAEGARGLVISFFTNPVYVLQVLFKEQKVFFFLALLVPLLFLPLVAGAKRIIMIYGLIFVGLASRPYVFSLHFQYSSVLFPALLVSVPDAIERVSKMRIPAALGWDPRRLAWTLMLGSVLATFLTTYKFGVMFENKSFHAGWNRMDWSHDRAKQQRYRFLRSLTMMIPDEAAVCSTSDLGPHVSSRAQATKWPKIGKADYLLLNLKRFRGADERRLDRMVGRGEFREIGRNHGLALFERVPEEERATARAEAAEQRKGQTAKDGAKKKQAKERQADAIDEAEDFRSRVRGDEKDEDKENDKDGDREEEEHQDERESGPPPTTDDGERGPD